MLEIAAITNLVDRFIQLLSHREQLRQQDFEKIIEPMFQDASLVAKDYMALLAELDNRLGRGDDLVAIIRWLEERRTILLAVRLKLRAMLHEFRSGPQWRQERRENQPRSLSGALHDGVLGLLSGGLSLVEEGHVEIGHPESGGYMGHTILDILYGSASERGPLDRHRILQNARRQREAVQQAWSEATQAYAALRKAAYT